MGHPHKYVYKHVGTQKQGGVVPAITRLTEGWCTQALSTWAMTLRGEPCKDHAVGEAGMLAAESCPTHLCSLPTRPIGTCLPKCTLNVQASLCGLRVQACCTHTHARPLQ